MNYMKAHFSLEEDWRIFPVDTEQVFQLSIDHGVLGTAYALLKIESDISVELRDWLIRACRYSSPLPGLLNGAAGAAWLFDEMNCSLKRPLNSAIVYFIRCCIQMHRLDMVVLVWVWLSSITGSRVVMVKSFTKL